MLLEVMQIFVLILKKCKGVYWFIYSKTVPFINLLLPFRFLRRHCVMHAL